MLRYFCCGYNNLTELDVSHCPELIQLYTQGNPISELDLSNNPSLPLDLVRASGDGTIGYFFEDGWQGIQSIVYAQPNEGSAFKDAEFLGWYNDSGELLSTSLEYNFSSVINSETVLIARFSGGAEPVLPGDIDMNGEVAVSDAILALRAAMGIYELNAEEFVAGDMDGSGSVTVSDAVLILRTAMGIA